MEQEYNIGDEVTIHRKVTSSEDNESEWFHYEEEGIMGKTGTIESTKLFDGVYRV